MTSPPSIYVYAHMPTLIHIQHELNLLHLLSPPWIDFQKVKALPFFFNLIIILYMTNFIQKILKPTENFYMKFKKKMLFFVRTIHRFF